MKIIGAGYGRTGTKSLQLALQQLGYGKCYHMEELFRNPQGVKQWKNAMLKRKVNWEELFAGYQSMVDFPGCIYYKELFDHYPDSKVVLSVRDPEAWYESARATIYSFDPRVSLKLKMLLSSVYSSTARDLFKVILLNNKSIWGNHFDGKFEDKDYAIQKFKNHIEEVKNTIPKDRLLVHEAKDGWEPLCKFLDKPIPKEPYPRTNQQKDFALWAEGIVEEVLQ